MEKKLEEYKLLVDIYYKELNLFYSKSTIFVSIQLGVLAGVIAGYEMLKINQYLFGVALSFMILFSVIQILVAIRGNNVNEAIIKTITEFEENNGFSLLYDFSKNIKKKRIGKMNFPSYMMVYIFELFLLAWVTILFIVLSPVLYEVMEVVKYSEVAGVLHSIIMCICAMLYAVTMKISDLLDEHGLHFFNGDTYFFSLLCAIFGCLLIISDTVVANIIFAMIIGFVIRKRVDYNNHILAFLILSSCFLVCSHLIISIYFSFLFVIILLGFLKDTKYSKNKTKIIDMINKIYLFVPIIYAIPSLIYSIISSDWIVFWVFFTYDFTYNVTRLIGERGSIARKNEER